MKFKKYAIFSTKLIGISGEKHATFSQVFYNNLLFISKPSIFKALSCRENQHSDFLAYLLNPNANHGLGKKFLKKFCEALEDEELKAKINGNDNKDISVVRESVIDNGQRIDILITGKNFAIVIENKFGSKEGNAQCENYKRFIDCLPYDCKKYIYLDLNKKEANDNEYKCFNYENIQEVVKSFIKDEKPTILNQYLTCLNDFCKVCPELDYNLQKLQTELQKSIEGAEIHDYGGQDKPYSILVEEEKYEVNSVKFVIDLFDGFIFKVLVYENKKLKFEYPYQKMLLNYSEFVDLLCEQKEEKLNEFAGNFKKFFDGEEFKQLKRNVKFFLNNLKKTKKG